MSKHHQALNFSGFSGYYGFMSGHSGYGGFNYESDVLYMNQSAWTAPGGWGYQRHWCDTGYQNVAAAAHATSLAWIYSYGMMETASSKTFTMDSLVAAASWSRDASWDINSYTERKGKLVLKASDALTISQTAQKINFAKFGHKGDFANIAAVAFDLVSSGGYGNSCTYKGGRIGVQLCLDAVKVKFAKKADLTNDGGRLLSPWLLHHQQAAAQVAAQPPHVLHDQSGTHDHSPPHHDAGVYHSQLLSLGHERGLTSQFVLPQPEHFGT